MRPEDVIAVAALLKQMHAETQYGAWVNASMASICEHLEDMKDDPDSTVIVLDDLTGAIGVSVGPEPFGVREIAVERFFYVSPDRRGCGVRLYRAAEKWARDKGAAVLAMIAPANADRVHELYQRLGFCEAERQFVKAL